MYILNGKELLPGQQFTDADGTQYPADWLALSTPDERAAIGIVEQDEPVRPDDRFYYVTRNEDGSYSASPKPVEPFAHDLCMQIDTHCASVYLALSGSLSVEYALAEADAIAYRDAGYKGTVPLGVKAHVALKPKAAADDIIKKAEEARALVRALRVARLAGKEAVKNAADCETAQAAFDVAIAEISSIRGA